MAPQTSIPPAANIFGTIGTVFWCIQLVPQIWYNWKQKKTDGLPGLMMFLWALCAVPLGIYCVVQNFNIPMQIQPQIFCVLALVTWVQILIYNNKWTTWKATFAGTGVAVLLGAIEAFEILTIKPLYDRGLEWPIMVVGVVGAILITAGLIPPYFELWKRKGRVVGINFIFLTIDWLGGFFSLMGVVTQNTFDPLGGCLFIVCMFIEGGIFASHGIWLFRTRKLRAIAKATGQDFDEMPESAKYHVEVSRRGSLAGSIAGSIAAARNDEHDEIARKGSSDMARDLELGLERKTSIVQQLKDGIPEESPIKKEVQVTHEEVPAGSSEGVESVDYGNMETHSRPGFKRMDTNKAGFKAVEW